MIIMTWIVLKGLIVKPNAKIISTFKYVVFIENIGPCIFSYTDEHNFHVAQPSSQWLAMRAIVNDNLWRHIHVVNKTNVREVILLNKNSTLD